MKELFSDLYTSFLILFVSTTIIYLLGHFVYSFVKQDETDKFNTFFTKIVVGLFIVVISYSIFATRFITIYSGLLLVVIVYYSANYKLLTLRIKKNITGFEFAAYFYFLISLFVICLFYSYLYSFDKRLFTHSDFTFYASIASSFHNFGIEYPNADPFIYGKITANIYHYFNEWLVAFYMLFTKLTSLKIYLLIILPLQTSIIFAGAISLTKKTISEISNYNRFLFSFLFILIPGLFSYFSYLVVNLDFNSSYSILLGGIGILKLKIVIILLLVYLNNEKSGLRHKNYLSLIIIPLVWPTLIPAFLGGYILFVIYKLILKKVINWSTVLIWLLPIIAIFCYVLLFNSVHSSNLNLLINDTNQYGLIDYVTDIYKVPKAIFRFCLIFVLPLIISFIAIVIIKKKYPEKIVSLNLFNYDILLIFILLASYFSFGALFGLFNSLQILLNILFPIFNIFVFQLSLLLLTKYGKISSLILIFIYILVIAIALIDKSPKESVNNKLNIIEIINHDNRKPCLIAVDLQKEKKPLYLYKKLYADLLMYNEDFKPVNLNLIIAENNLKNPVDRFEFYGSVSNQTFYKYMINNKLYKNVDSAKYKFLNQFKFDYLIVSQSILLEKNNYISKLNVDTVYMLQNNLSMVTLKDVNK